MVMPGKNSYSNEKLKIPEKKTFKHYIVDINNNNIQKDCALYNVDFEKWDEIPSSRNVYHAPLNLKESSDSVIINESKMDDLSRFGDSNALKLIRDASRLGQNNSQIESSHFNESKSSKIDSSNSKNQNTPPNRHRMKKPQTPSIKKFGHDQEDHKEHKDLNRLMRSPSRPQSEIDYTPKSKCNKRTSLCWDVFKYILFILCENMQFVLKFIFVSCFLIDFCVFYS